MKSIDEVWARVYDLEYQQTDSRDIRQRIRSVMRGGIEGLQALLGDDMELDQYDFPVVHLMDTGLRRVAQKIGRIPTLKVPIPYSRQHRNDSQRGRDHSELVRQIVTGYDERQNLELQLPQAGRWLPGYGSATWVMKTRQTPDGPYPIMVLEDPYDCFYGKWDEITQQPVDMTAVRTVSLVTIARLYGSAVADLIYEGRGRNRYGPGNHARPVIAGARSTATERDPDTVKVYDYYDEEGRWVVAENGVELEFMENPLTSGPMFVTAPRISFSRDEYESQFIHLLGLMAIMAKYNMLGLIATEQATFAETNVAGQVISNNQQYQFGEEAVNILAPGTQVSRNQSQVPFQLFNQIDRVERQIRIAMNYPVIADAESPNAWVTGKGVDSLATAVTTEIGEYHKALGFALRLMDWKRLEYDQVMFGSLERYAEGSVRGEAFSQKYKGTDIEGLFRTERVYGVMAGVDEPQKIISFLQLMDAGIVDDLTVQENLDGLENLPRINRRIVEREVRRVLLNVLEQEAAQGDPTAKLALAKLLENGDKAVETIKQLYTPAEPQPSPEEAAFMQAGMGGQAPALPQPTPDITTILSRLGGAGTEGGAEQGIQTVARV